MVMLLLLWPAAAGEMYKLLSLSLSHLSLLI
jgi:hypothetical protein